MEIVQWSKIREEIEPLLKARKQDHLFAVLDRLANELKENGFKPELHVDEMPFGEPILDDTSKPIGTMALSDKKTTQMYFQGNSFPEELAYAQVPLGIILQNGVEIFDKRNERESRHKNQPHVHHAPLKLLFEGDFFGVFQTLDFLAHNEVYENDPWTMIAGARSVQFSFSTSSAQIKKAFRKADEVFGFINSPTSGVAAGDTHHKIIKKLADAFSPQWRVRYALFPVQWLIEDGVSKNTRAVLETCLYKMGWVQSKPIMTTVAQKSKFRKEWSQKPHPYSGTLRGLKGSHLTKDEQKLGQFAFNLFLIDRGLQPCLVDLRSAIAGTQQQKYMQTIPAAPEILLYLMLVAHHHGLDYYSTLLVPGYMEPNVGSGFLSFACTDARIPTDQGDRGELLSRMFALLGVSSDSRIPWGSSSRIDANTLTFIAGAGTGDQGKPFMLDLYTCDSREVRPANYCQHLSAQYPIPEKLLDVRPLKEKSQPSKKELPPILSDEKLLISLQRASTKPGAFGKFGLGWHIRFLSRDE